MFTDLGRLVWSATMRFVQPQPTGKLHLGMLGYKDDMSISWDKVAKRCEALKTRGLGEARLHDPESVKKMYVGKLSALDLANAEINTLNNARLEILAGLHRVTLDPRTKGRLGKDAYLQGENWSRFSKLLDGISVPDH